MNSNKMPWEIYKTPPPNENTPKKLYNQSETSPVHLLLNY